MGVESDSTEKDSLISETPYHHYSEEVISSDYDHEEEKVVKLITLQKIPDIEEQERSRKLWIPLEPVEDIDDYQNFFESEQEEVLEETEFLRPSALPEAPMLKQGKEPKSQAVESSVPVSMVYSSSSTILTSSILLVLALPLSTLFH